MSSVDQELRLALSTGKVQVNAAKEGGTFELRKR